MGESNYVVSTEAQERRYCGNPWKASRKDLITEAEREYIELESNRGKRLNEEFMNSGKPFFCL